MIYKRRPDFPPAAWEPALPGRLVFDGLIELEGIDLARTTLVPGQAWPMRLTWNALADVKSQIVFSIELVNVSTGERRPLLENATPLYDGAPTRFWRQGERYVDDQLLALPLDLPPGSYRVLIHPQADGRELLPADQAGPAMTRALSTEPPPAPFSGEAEPLRFDAGFELAGIEAAPAASDRELIVTLLWRARRPIATPGTVFVHVLDANRQLIGQSDAPPAGGALPMPLWAEDVIVRDPHPVTLTAELSSAAQLCLGVYDPVTVQRLGIVGGAGYAVLDNVACRPMPALRNP